MVLNRFYSDQVESLKLALEQEEKLPSILLTDFFDDIDYGELKEQVEQLPFSESFNLLTHNYESALLNQDKLPQGLLDFLEIFFGKKVALEATAYKIKHRSYKILHDSEHEAPGLELIIPFTKKWPKTAGGEVVYVDGTGSYEEIPHLPKSLAIVNRKEDMNWFVKYVNNKAKKKEALFLRVKVKHSN